MRRNFGISVVIACLGVAAWFAFGPRSTAPPASLLLRPVETVGSPRPGSPTGPQSLDPWEIPLAPEVPGPRPDPHPRLSVRVVNYSGDPVAGASVRISQVGRDEQHVTTDDDGRFEAEVESDRPVRLVVTCGGCDELVVVHEVQAVPSELVVSEKARIRVVVDETVRPWISEFDVKLRGPEGESLSLWAEPMTTGIDFVVRAGPHEFVVYGGPCVPLSGDLTLRGGEIAVLHYPGTEETGALVISVVDRDDGSPIPRATVHIRFDLDDELMQMTTKQDGTTAIFGFLEGIAWVEVSASGYAVATFRQSQIPRTAKRWEVGLTPLARLEVVVRRSGLPVPEVVVGIERDDARGVPFPERRELLILGLLRSDRGVTDEAGRIRVEQVPCGSYRVRVRSTAGRLLAMSSLEMGEDDRLVELDLPPISRVRGTVLRNGEAVSGELRFVSGELAVTLEVSPSGRFDGDVALEHCGVWFCSNGFETLLDELTLPIDRPLELRYQAFELVVDFPRERLRPPLLLGLRGLGTAGAGDTIGVETFHVVDAPFRVLDVPAGTYDVQLLDDRSAWRSAWRPVRGDYYPTKRITIDRNTRVSMEPATIVGVSMEFLGRRPLLVGRLLPSGVLDELGFSVDGSTLEIGWPEHEIGWGLIQPSGVAAPLFFRVDGHRSVHPPRLEPHPAARLVVDGGRDSTNVTYRIRPDGWEYGPSSYWNQVQSATNPVTRILAPGRYRVHWLDDDVEMGSTVVDVEAGAQARAMITDDRR